MEGGRCVAIEGDPSERKHSEELHCHKPVEVMGSDERSKAEKQCLHEDREGELNVDVLDVVDESGNDNATDKLTSAENCQSLVGIIEN